MKRIGLLLILLVLVSPVSAGGFFDFLFPAPTPTPFPDTSVVVYETPYPTPTPIIFNNATGDIAEVSWMAEPLAKQNGTQPVQFYATTINAAYWKWDFGNGQTSMEENPLAVYNSSGGYTVSLIAGNEAHENSYTAVNNVNVNLQDGEA